MATTKNDTKDYILVELGAGKGTLMLDLLRATKNIEGFHSDIEIHIVEISPELTLIQKQALKEYKNIKWHKSIEKLPDKPMILVANEFFDALPINQYVKQDGNWLEKFVSLNDKDEFCFILEESFISKQLNKTHANLPDDSVYEISLASDAIMQIIVEKIKKNGGGALIVDYGYEKQEFNNTFQAVKDHKYCDVLQNVSKADLTSHVNFEELIRNITNNKIINYNLNTQANFLKMMGIDERCNQLVLNAKNDIVKNEIISAKSRLVDNDKMGSLFKVLSLVC